MNTSGKRFRHPLARIGIGISILVAFGSDIFAQDNNRPFTPEQGRLFLGSAAERARQKQRENARTFEEFKQVVTKEPFPGGKYIVNGDTPISTEEDLLRFYKEAVEAPQGATTEFAVLHVNGQDVIWKPQEASSISYCISNSAFGGRYNTVVTAMADATRAWEAVAKVRFIHQGQEDSNCTASNPNVVFDVRPVNVNQYLARAFFPNDARPQRNVLIDNSSFELPSGERLSLTGILRHELGHVLGARHEHTRPQAGTCFEDNDWRGVTNYDALSVMHYPQCNGKGDWSLTLTVQDKNGVACVYGAAPGFNIDPKICTPK